MALDASTLITTVGGSTSNSYVSLADFADYCDRRLNASAFTDAEPDDKIRALLQAVRRLEDENWLGARVTSTQALAWPRADAPKRDSGYGSDYYGADYGSGRAVYLTTEIPQPIKDAQCELALAYLGDFDDGEEDAIESFAADSVSVKFRESKPSGSLPVSVSRLIGALTRGNRLVRA